MDGPGYNLGEWCGVPSSCAVLDGLAIGARFLLLWQHSAERKMSASACTRSVPGLNCQISIYSAFLLYFSCCLFACLFALPTVNEDVYKVSV